MNNVCLKLLEKFLEYILILLELLINCNIYLSFVYTMLEEADISNGEKKRELMNPIDKLVELFNNCCN